jgi:ATP-binding protein involved in chromosome partitioning
MEHEVREALARVSGPRGAALAAEARGVDVHVSNGTVVVTLTVDAADAAAFEPARAAAEAALRALPGVGKAFVALTAERQAGGAPRAPAPVRPGGPAPVDGVKRIVAVASGKGGVGKSTTAANLALAFAARGLAVGLLDADIYGPSVPRLMGTAAKPELGAGGKLTPVAAHGLKVMSIGFMVEPETALIWRGPMIDSALTQMLRDVAWAPLDLLLVDMPPGTGDAQLTLAQKTPLDGAIVVSTPQDLALIDARRGVAMFEKAGVPVLGIVENMSTFVCPHCGARHDLFGHGGAKAEAERIGARFLGEVPLHLAIRRDADAGRPTVAADPGGPHAHAYAEIAARAWAALTGEAEPARASPFAAF